MFYFSIAYTGMATGHFGDAEVTASDIAIASELIGWIPVVEPWQSETDARAAAVKEWA